jgi:hypothetical protein
MIYLLILVATVAVLIYCYLKYRQTAPKNIDTLVQRSRDLISTAKVYKQMGMDADAAQCLKEASALNELAKASKKT